MDEGQLNEGPEFRNRDDEYGASSLMWTPDEIRFGLSSDASTDMLIRAELLELRSSIDKALRAESKLDLQVHDEAAPAPRNRNRGRFS